jgi:23S rRNA pseudouridine955/2504/2580 synthase
LCAEDKSNIHIIGEAEAGTRLLRFLERGLGLPRPLLFRLLRSGQVRVNKGRAKPESVLLTGDAVRLPPALAFPGRADPEAAPAGLNALPELGPNLRIVQAGKHWLALDKGPGLPVQPGSAHEDSLSARLRQAFARLSGGVSFTPAPAHRLDKQSTGLVMAGRTPLGQRWLSALFAGDKRELLRIYLVWVSGQWESAGAETLRDRLVQKRGPDGLERMYRLAGPEQNDAAREAAASYRPLKFIESSPCGPASLLEVQLFSGRKHQIRVQCAERGHPVIGDRRYGGPLFRQMLLHAAKISLPAAEDYYGESFAAVRLCLDPPWPAPFNYSIEP